MERPLVLIPLQELALLRHQRRPPRQRPLDPLLKVRLGPLGLRTFSMTIRGSITNSRSSTSKSASPSSSGNAAIVASIPYGLAGVLGAFVAALFV